jgi:cyanate lyase
MTKTEMTAAILAAKKKQKVSWTFLAKAVGASPVFVTSACLGMNSLQPEAARKLCLPPLRRHWRNSHTNSGIN